ncbi:leucine-rich repeat domain-containing protein [Silvanigrella aquatica]|uniref:Uncharacterized protein n=1 Tax=Silvanigrella aquatica TaxID=1915309 RepID=A0A1L4CYL9_9BACT|nr:leucine-rich repeat protein [Silvanigrella aquatica]APJ03030.1 hypothetical protein AXG55_03515 [Silvanigrella aquatica]
MALCTFVKKTVLFSAFALFNSNLYANTMNKNPISLNSYERIVYFIPDERGIIQAKVAQSQEGNATLGGVTGSPKELSSFSITFTPQTRENETELKEREQYYIKSLSRGFEVCQSIPFKVTKYKVEILPSRVHLKTATQCEFGVFNKKKQQLASFHLLLNHTYNYWCHLKDENSTAYKTARHIDNNCALHHANTKYISLNGRDISDLSPLTGFHNLVELSLENNRISSLPIGILDNFSELKKLILRKNSIFTIQPGTFDKLTKLSWLWLMENEITHLPRGVFDKLENLDWLSLYQNKLEYIPKGLLSKLKNLEGMELSFNLLKKFPEDILELNKLISLEIHNNIISEIPMNAFVNAKKLVNLSLSRNNLTTLPENLFKENSKLVYLKLAHNQITHLPLGIFDPITNTEEIDLTGNPITIWF